MGDSAGGDWTGPAHPPVQDYHAARVALADEEGVGAHLTVEAGPASVLQVLLLSVQHQPLPSGAVQDPAGSVVARGVEVVPVCVLRLQ